MAAESIAVDARYADAVAVATTSHGGDVCAADDIVDVCVFEGGASDVVETERHVAF